MDTETYFGGCLCGAIRYRCTAITDAGYCHCAHCRRASGGAVIAWAHVPAAEFALVEGEPAQFAITDRGCRRFCSNCGSTLYFEAADASWYSVTIATFDRPQNIEPAVHICTDDGLVWLNIDDDLPHIPDADVPAPDER